MEKRPSRRYMKHGFLEPSEKYNQTIHSVGDIYEKNINNNTNPTSTFYTPEEIEDMKREIKPAECSICYEQIKDSECRMCDNGHKFHYKCTPQQGMPTTKCPECKSVKLWRCTDYNDIFSGGKNKKSKKTRKSKKTKKSRKSKKSRGPHH
jgi:hypothetical protein